MSAVSKSAKYADSNPELWWIAFSRRTSPAWEVITKSVFEERAGVSPLLFWLPGKNIRSPGNRFHQSYQCYWASDVILRLVRQYNQLMDWPSSGHQSLRKHLTCFWSLETQSETRTAPRKHLSPGYMRIAQSFNIVKFNRDRSSCPEWALD